MRNLKNLKLLRVFDEWTKLVKFSPSNKFLAASATIPGLIVWTMPLFQPTFVFTENVEKLH